MDVGAGVRLALAPLAAVLLAAACGGDEPSEPAPTGGLTPDLHTPPPLAVELFDMNLTAEEVSEAIGATYPENPHSLPSAYEEGWQWWFIPSADPPGPGLKPITPEPQVESFAMPSRYYEAGFLGLAVKRISRPSGSYELVPRPTQIDLGIARYEDNEGAQEALALGARIYGLIPLSTLLSDDAQLGRGILETVELHGIGDGAVVDRVASATAVSVRVDNHVGTVIAGLSWPEGNDVPLAAEALAAALAEKLAEAR